MVIHKIRSGRRLFDIYQNLPKDGKRKWTENIHHKLLTWGRTSWWEINIDGRPWRNDIPLVATTVDRAVLVSIIGRPKSIILYKGGRLEKSLPVSSVTATVHATQLHQITPANDYLQRRRQ